MAKDLKEKPKAQPTTRRQATRGKVVHLHKYWKGIAALNPNAGSARHYVTMMIDATMCEHEWKTKRGKNKEQLSED